MWRDKVRALWRITTCWLRICEDFAKIKVTSREIDLTSGILLLGLFDASTDRKVAGLVDGGTVVAPIDAASRTLVATYTVDGELVGGSYEFRLFDSDNNLIQQQVENTSPYALFGDNDSNFNLGTTEFSDGSYRLEVYVYSEQNSSGALLTSQSFSFDVTYFELVSEPPLEFGETRSLFDLRAVDAVTGQEFAFITDGAIIFDNGVSPENRTIKVDYVGDYTTNDDDGSILIELFDSNNALVHAQMENMQPYALFGDNMEGQFKMGVGLLNGEAYRLDLTMFDQDNGLGSVIGRESLNITFFSL